MTSPKAMFRIAIASIIVTMGSAQTSCQQGCIFISESGASCPSYATGQPNNNRCQLTTEVDIFSGNRVLTVCPQCGGCTATPECSGPATTTAAQGTTAAQTTMRQFSTTTSAPTTAPPPPVCLNNGNFTGPRGNCAAYANAGASACDDFATGSTLMQAKQVCGECGQCCNQNLGTNDPYACPACSGNRNSFDAGFGTVTGCAQYEQGYILGYCSDRDLSSGRLARDVCCECRSCGVCPTAAPTSGAPTTVPTTSPTEVPTSVAPTGSPTAPTDAPTGAPTNPSLPPTEAPTDMPTEAPTNAPTEAPTSAAPTTAAPTESPTSAAPTMTPTTLPPTAIPTNAPTTLAPTPWLPPCPAEPPFCIGLTHDEANAVCTAFPNRCRRLCGLCDAVPTEPPVSAPPTSRVSDEASDDDDDNTVVYVIAALVFIAFVIGMVIFMRRPRDSAAITAEVQKQISQEYQNPAFPQSGMVAGPAAGMHPGPMYGGSQPSSPAIGNGGVYPVSAWGQQPISPYHPGMGGGMPPHTYRSSSQPAFFGGPAATQGAWGNPRNSHAGSPGFNGGARDANTSSYVEVIGTEEEPELKV
eukprot:m.51235 g.51235  ORF g.51235 m.51235 type:complete len:582 (+) comp7291_c1_seq1:82-1827(+)